jgi:RNA polymerase sigma-70 factor (ECF subfamily)
MRGLTVSSDRLRDLVEKAQRGDRDAFEKVIHEVEGGLRSSIRSRIGRHLRLEVDDVFQETLTRAFESLSRFEWKGEDSFLRWLRGIAENLIRATADKQRRRTALEIERPAKASSQVSPSRALQREERLDRLEQAVQALSPDHREVVRLARIEGLQVDEIAKRLGRTPSAVKNLLLRALKELKKSFGDTESFRLPQRPPKDEGVADVE